MRELTPPLCHLGSKKEAAKYYNPCWSPLHCLTVNHATQPPFLHPAPGERKNGNCCCHGQARQQGESLGKERKELAYKMSVGMENS